MSLKLVVYWICLWITVTHVSANYVLSDKTITWHNASLFFRDNFATPKLQADNSSFTVNIASKLEENEEAWVGYYKKMTAFSYIACGRIHNAKPKVTLPVSRNSPGLCYSMCNTTFRNYIGLNNGKCFCMIEIRSEDIKLPSCNNSVNGNWVAGGGDKYMSIYERLNTDIIVTDSAVGGMCLNFQNNNQRWWGKCDTAYLALCKNGDDFKNFHDDHGQHYLHWRYYVQLCFKYDYLPISYDDISNYSIKQAISQSWTNVILSDVIYKYNDVSNSINGNNVKGFGYITQNKSKTLLSFTEDSSILKMYLLQTIPVTNPTSHMSQEYTTNTVSRSTKSASQDIFTRSSPSSSSSSILSSPSKGGVSQTTITSEDGFQPKTASNVSVAVSVSVVIVVLVAAAVILITLKRRGKIPFICNRNPDLDNFSRETSKGADKLPTENNLYVASQETAYAQIGQPKANDNVDARQDLELSNGHYAHTYFVLEPGTRESNTDVDISDPGKDNTDINDEYNTLHETVNARTKGNDTYDTTEKAALKVKAQQTAENGHESPKMFNQTEEDTYNRIDRSPLKNGKTDNIYGIPNCLENDYGDVGKSREKNLQDGDDTYNHVKLNQ